MRLRIPFRSRRSGGQTEDVRPDAGQTPDIPWWVPIFTNWGRPLAAIVVLVLCAPGEQHLAYLAGWNGNITWLSWGWAGLLSLYAGISAVVATVRPRGARGKATAVVGAGLSLLLAMAAQPVSHMFTTGWLSAEPRPPLWLVIIVSGIPPFILGHLLHLAASPVRTVVSGGQDAPAGRTVPVPSWATEEKARRASRPVRTDKPVRTPAPDTGQTVSLEKADKVSRPVLMADVSAGQTAGSRVPSLRDKQSMSARALDLVRLGQDDDSIKDTLRTEFPDKDGNAVRQGDSIRKAIKRARDKVSRAS